jgi:hypothetical protein
LVLSSCELPPGTAPAKVQKTGLVDTWSEASAGVGPFPKRTKPIIANPKKRITPSIKLRFVIFSKSPIL